MPLKHSSIQSSRSRSSPSMTSLKHRDNLFKKKLESIREYINLLQDDPQQASFFEKQCERNFYKTQLKAAIAINFSLVKLIQDKENEIYGLLSEIKEQRKQNQNQQRLESPKRPINNQNSQFQANKTILTPKQHIKRALEAQKQILGAKFSQQKEEYRRNLQRKEQILKSSKQQNVFLRQKLFQMGQKMAVLQQQNHLLRFKAKNIQRNLNLDGNEEQTKIHARVLNFSPIDKREDDNKICIEEISFNQTPQKNKSALLSDPANRTHQDNTKIQCSRKQNFLVQARQKRYYQQLEKEYAELKEEMDKAVKELQQYKALLHELKIHFEDNVVYREEISSVLTRPFDSSLTRNQKSGEHQLKRQSCPDCLKLKILNQNLYEDLERTREDLAVIKVNFQRAINLERKYQQEWNILINEGTSTDNR